MNLLRLDDKNLFYKNGVLLGQVLMKEDGFYDFWPELRGGCWSEDVLQEIATLLKEKNREWSEQISKELR